MSRLNEIQEYIAELKSNVDIKKLDALNRLAKNKDFKLIIDDGYFKDEAVRAVMLKADPTQESPECQEHLDKLITSIGYLRQYFRTITAQGVAALNRIEEAEQALVEEQLESSADENISNYTE